MKVPYEVLSDAATIIELEQLLAAKEARITELRSALDHLVKEWVAWRAGLTGAARTRAERALAAPDDYATLRAFGERVALAAMEAVAPEPCSREDAERIVASLLPPQPGAEVNP